jgi:hypothetical protein
MIMADFDQTLSKYYYPDSMTVERNKYLGLDECPSDTLI